MSFCRRYQKLFQRGCRGAKERQPWQEVQITENINLFELMPHFRLNPGDGGLYINKASVRFRIIQIILMSGNVGMYRFASERPETGLSATVLCLSTISRCIFQAAERENRPLPHRDRRGQTIQYLASVASMPLLYGQYEFQMASAPARGPLSSGNAPKMVSRLLGVPNISSKAMSFLESANLTVPTVEFTGPPVRAAKTWYRSKSPKSGIARTPIYEYTSIGMPWTEIDYMFLNTCPPLYAQLKEKFSGDTSGECALYAWPYRHRFLRRRGLVASARRSACPS